MEHAHTDRCKQNQDNGNRKEYFSLSKEVDRFSFFLSSVEFFIAESHGIECIYQQSGDYQRGKHGKNDTKSQCHGKSFDTSASHCTQNGCCDQGCDVTVHDGGHRFLETDLDGTSYALTCCNFLTDTCIDDNVRIYRHTDGKNDTCDTRKGQCQVKGI